MVLLWFPHDSQTHWRNMMKIGIPQSNWTTVYGEYTLYSKLMKTQIIYLNASLVSHMKSISFCDMGNILSDTLDLSMVWQVKLNSRSTQREENRTTIYIPLHLLQTWNKAKLTFKKLHTGTPIRMHPCTQGFASGRQGPPALTLWGWLECDIFFIFGLRLFVHRLAYFRLSLLLNLYHS